MNIKNTFKMALILEIIMFIALSLAIFVTGTVTATRYYFYELIGVLLASIITTFGIYGMREIT